MPALTVRINDRLHKDVKLVAALSGMTENDETRYSVQRLRYALKQISELMTMEPAAIARAKGEGK